MMVISPHLICTGHFENFLKQNTHAQNNCTITAQPMLYIIPIGSSLRTQRGQLCVFTDMWIVDQMIVMQ